MSIDSNFSTLRISSKQRRPRQRRSKQGFSLIELLATLSLVSLISSFILPSFGKFIAAQQVRDASFQIRNFFTGAKLWVVKNRYPILICASTDASECDRNWSGNIIMVADLNRNNIYEPDIDKVLRQEQLSARHLDIRAGRNLYHYRLRNNGGLAIIGDSIFVCHPRYDDIGLRVVLWRTGSYRITDQDSDGNAISCAETHQI